MESSPVSKTPKITARMQALELAFDRESLATFDGQAWPEGLKLLTWFQKGEWESVYSRGTEIFHKTESLVEKAFILHWLVASTELEYDLSQRSRLIALWSEIPGWIEHDFCRYLRAYQEGLGHFFAGALNNAEVCFSRALEDSRTAGYSFGEMRVLFHLGLVKRDLNDTKAAQSFFEQAWRISQNLRSVRFNGRITGALQALPIARNAVDLNLDSYSKGLIALESQIRRGDFQKARSELAQLEIQRRKWNWGRRRADLGKFLAVIQFGLGKNSAGERLLSRIDDLISKQDALRMKAQGIGLSGAEKAELSYFESLSGSGIKTQAPAAVDPMASIRDQEIKALLTLLLMTNVPVDKEAIVRSVWRFNYDPISHDPKIYRLIRRTREALSEPNAILNRYGAYELDETIRKRFVRAS